MSDRTLDGHLTALVIANMVGAGVFTTTGLAVGAAGSALALWVLWGLAGVYALTGAWLYGRLARAFPHNGGEHLLLGRMLHPALGTAAGWISLTAGFAGPIAAAAIGLDAYTRPGVGALTVGGLAALHVLRPGAGWWAQSLAVLAKAVLIGLIGLSGALWPVRDAVLADRVAPGALFGVAVWLTFAYSGWNAAVYLAGEHPPARIGRAALLGTALVTVLYLGLNGVFLFAVPTEAIAGRVDVAVATAEALGGGWRIGVTRIAASMALVTSISSLLLAGSGVVDSMLRSGDLPGGGGDTGVNRRVGLGALAGAGVAGALVADLASLLGALGWSLALCSGLAVLGGLIRGVLTGPAAVGAVAFLGGTLGVLLGSAQHQPLEAAASATVFGMGVAYGAWRGRD